MKFHLKKVAVFRDLTLKKLFQHDINIVPLEAKAETNLKSRSLMCFCRKYKKPYAVRTSMAGHRKDMTDTLPSRQNDNAGDFKFMLENLPLYAISQIESIGDETLQII